jgi:hypothetical protein
MSVKTGADEVLASPDLPASANCIDGFRFNPDASSCSRPSPSGRSIPGCSRVSISRQRPFCWTGCCGDNEVRWRGASTHVRPSPSASNR